MIELNCPHCQRHYRLRDNSGGKKAKCSCGGSFVVPVLRENHEDTLACAGCQSPVQKHWKACPACGDPLPIAESPSIPDPPEESQASSIDVQARDCSIIKADIDQSSSEDLQNTAGCHSCPHCQQVTQPHWKACPFCGEVLSPHKPQDSSPENPGESTSNRSDIDTGDNNAINANFSKRASLRNDGDMNAQISGHEQSAVRAGDSSVIKADVNQSRNYSVAGNVIQGDAPHFHSERHFHKTTGVAAFCDLLSKESGRQNDMIRSMQNIDQAAGEEIKEEFLAAGESDEKMLRVVAKNIAAMEAMSFSSIQRQTVSNQIRETICRQALEMVRIRSERNSNTQKQCQHYENRLNKARASHKRQFLMTIVGILFAMLGVSILGLVMATYLDKGTTALQEDIVELIEKGRFDAARIKARELPASEEDDIIEDINRAEQRWESKNR